MLINQPKDIDGNILKVGDEVMLLAAPSELLSNLPIEDQNAVKAQVGNILIVQDIDEYGNPELEFYEPDEPNHSHTIWLDPINLKKKMENFSKDPFEQLGKFKFAGKAIGYLYLALFSCAGIYAATELLGSEERYRLAGILIIVLVFSFLSNIAHKKYGETEKHSRSSLLIGAITTVIIMFSIYIFLDLISK